MFVSSENTVQPEPFSTLSAARIPEQSMNFTFTIDFFSGPLDLLLHLVRQQEVAIEEVKMSLIADQYLEIISKSSFLDLDRASEYLVIAATLMSIKSQSVLSKNNIEDDPDNYEDSAFLEQLRERLKQYELTKMRASALRSIPQLGFDTFTRVDRKAFDFHEEEDLEPEEPQTLARAFLDLLKRVGQSSRSFLIRLEPISIVSFMIKVIDRLQSQESRKESFLGMVKTFLDNNSNRENKPEQEKTQYGPRGVIIGSFISLLELAKRGVVSVFQNNYDEDISVEFRLSENKEGKIALDSEFDATVESATPLASKIVKISDYLIEEQDSNEPIADLLAAAARKEANCG